MGSWTFASALRGAQAAVLATAVGLALAVLAQAPSSARAADPYPIRGIFDRDFSATGFDDEAALGFNLIDSDAYPDRIAPLAASGLKGFVWLGGYDNTTCTFNKSDDWVRSHVVALAGSPGVGAYLVDDEPDAVKCPTAPAQVAARAKLVKSIDPGPPTFIVAYKNDQLKLFAGTVDVIVIDKYPCSIANGCVYGKIDDAAATADRLGIRYWGVVQAHGDGWYRVPTPDELHEQFDHWRATNMQGYLVFAWRWPPWDSSLWLAAHPELQRQLANENAQPRPVRQTSTFSPSADARVEEAFATTNFGTLSRLGSDGDAGARIASVLRFRVTGVSASVQSAKLWLYVVSDPTNDGPAVYPATGDWTETGVTWGNRPPITGAAVADMGGASAGEWVQLDVTSLVHADGDVNLLLEQPGTDGVVFYARQGGQPPQLVVTTDGPES
jgi:hypothetical protein